MLATSANFPQVPNFNIRRFKMPNISIKKTFFNNFYLGVPPGPPLEGAEKPSTQRVKARAGESKLFLVNFSKIIYCIGLEIPLETSGQPAREKRSRPIQCMDQKKLGPPLSP